MHWKQMYRVTIYQWYFYFRHKQLFRSSVTNYREAGNMQVYLDGELTLGLKKIFTAYG